MIIETKFDTQTKKLEVTADGKKIKNVSDVVFMGFSSDDEFFMDITTVDRSKQEDDGVTTRTHIMASEAGEIELGESVLPNSNEIIKEGLAKAFS